MAFIRCFNLKQRMNAINHAYWTRRTHIMGILNVTPDSFYDGEQYNAPERARQRVIKMIAEGADIIDIGAQSTKPGAVELTADEELERLLPCLEAILPVCTVPISIDTYRARVAAAALAMGAHIINDVSGLMHEPELAQHVASHGASLVLMHNRRLYERVEEGLAPGADEIGKVLHYFKKSIDIALQAGVACENLVLDPGLGFGMSLVQNVEILKNLKALKALDYPLLVGVSRKPFIGKMLGSLDDDRLFGTLATGVISVSKGANIVRVHDVKAHADAVKVVDLIGV